jgi:hypothetical protein
MFFLLLLEGDSEVHIYWKGAAELILESCTDWLDADGSKHSMTPEKVIYCSNFNHALKYNTMILLLTN